MKNLFLSILFAFSCNYDYAIMAHEKPEKEVIYITQTETETIVEEVEVEEHLE